MMPPVGLEPTLCGFKSFKWIRMNFKGLDICLFATVFVHRRPDESMHERTDL